MRSTSHVQQRAPRTAQELLEVPLAPPAWIVGGRDADEPGSTYCRSSQNWKITALREHRVCRGHRQAHMGQKHKCGMLLMLEETATIATRKSCSAWPTMRGRCKRASCVKTRWRNTRTRIIVVDTFQKIRNPIRDNAYAVDYDDMSVLKRFADERRIAVIVVRRTRKMPDSDVLATASGNCVRHNRLHRVGRFSCCPRDELEVQQGIDLPHHRARRRGSGAQTETQQYRTGTRGAHVTVGNQGTEDTPSMLRILDYMELLG